MLTMGLSKSQPVFTVWPLSVISMRTVAASGNTQPAMSASRNGMQRLTVSALSVVERWFLSTGARCRNHAGRASRAGTGGAITPTSSGAQRNSMQGSVDGVMGGLQSLLLLLELEELFDELLEEPLDELFDEPLLLEFDDRFDELLLERLLLEFDELLAELFDDRLLLELAELFEEPLLLEFDEPLAELFDEPLEELFDELLDERPPPLRGPLTSDRLLLLLAEPLLLEFDDRLDELLAERPPRSPRSSPRPTAAAADFMPRSQPLKKRCTGVSPRGVSALRWLRSSLACKRGAALRSTLGSWRVQSRSEGRACACTLLPVRRAATVAAIARRGCFMMGSKG